MGQIFWATRYAVDRTVDGITALGTLGGGIASVDMVVGS